MKNVERKESTPPTTKITKALALAVLLEWGNMAMANNDPTDFTPLTGEYVASNPGLEIAVPRWVNVDSNADGIKDGYNFHFDVYALGTKTTPLFSTPIKYLAYVPNGCGAQYQTPIVSDFNFNSINFRRISNIAIMSIGLSSSCRPQPGKTVPYTYIFSSYVYGVDISASGKTPWVKYFKGFLVGTGILPDINNNGVGEFAIDIGTGLFNSYPSTGAANVSVFVYDGETGASVTTAQQYTVEQ